jgi:hypothetical protein
MHYLQKIAFLLTLNIGLTAASRLAAETLTLTDKQGRALTAEVLSVDNGKVKIKRSDGQVFSLPVNSLVEDDQAKLAALAERLAATEAAKPLAADAIKVELSRANFKTTKKNNDAKEQTTGKTVNDVVSTSEENWGYTLTLYNRTPRPIEGLRAEYRLFATVDEMHVEGDKLVLKKKPFEASFESINPLGKITVRTETILTVKKSLKDGWIDGKTGRTESSERLYGIWLRIYRGDQLIQEIAMPEGLRTKQKW